MLFEFLGKIGEFDEKNPLKPSAWITFLETLKRFSNKNPLDNIRVEYLPEALLSDGKEVSVILFKDVVEMLITYSNAIFSFKQEMTE